MTSLMRIRDMTETEAAYLAGIIDGEAWLGIRQRGESRSPIITISNTSREIIGWLYRLYDDGGGPLPRLMADSLEERRTPCYQISFASLRDVGYILERTLPYLQARRELTEECLSILKERGYV